MIEVPRYRFDELVRRALDDIPPQFMAALDNVVVQVADRHDDEPEVLGVYDGVPLTERGDIPAISPDVIWIYRLALCDICDSEDELAHEVRTTVIHEIAHHFGIDDERLNELGWA